MAKGDSVKPKKKIEVFTFEGTSPIVGATVKINYNDENWMGTSNQFGITLFNLPNYVTSYNISADANGYVEQIRYSIIGNSNYKSEDFDLKKIPVPVPDPIPVYPGGPFKGNFCGIEVPGLPTFNSPCKVFYSPSYAVYSDDWRKKIRDGYNAIFGDWPSMIIGVSGGNVYSNHYPDIPYGQARKFIEELLKDHINPVINLLRDESNVIDPTIPLDLIRTAFVKWEMNQPTNNNSYVMAKNIWDCMKAVHEDCKVYVHFSPKHGAGIGDQPLYYCPNCDFPLVNDHNVNCPNCHRDVRPSTINNTLQTANGQWWQWAARVGIKGIFVQGEPSESVEQSRSLIEDFTERFGLGINGWPKGLDSVIMEFQVSNVYYDKMTLAQSNHYNKQLIDYNYRGSQPYGYLNGI